MECEKLPPASDLTVPPPPCNLDDFNEDKDLIVGRRFTLDEVITKGNITSRYYYPSPNFVLGYLYLEFLEFLKRRVCVETLLCHRIITIYEEAMAKKDYPIGNELGAYCYFSLY